MTYLKAGLIQLPDSAVEMADGATAASGRPVNKTRFPLGQTVVTAHALDLLRSDEIALGWPATSGVTGATSARKMPGQ